jgi:hypothetical protein
MVISFQTPGRYCAPQRERQATSTDYDLTAYDLMCLVYMSWIIRKQCPKAPGDQVRSNKLHYWTWFPGALQLLCTSASESAKSVVQRMLTYSINLYYPIRYCEFCIIEIVVEMNQSQRVIFVGLSFSQWEGYLSFSAHVLDRAVIRRPLRKRKNVVLISSCAALLFKIVATDRF